MKAYKRNGVYLYYHLELSQKELDDLMDELDWLCPFTGEHNLLEDVYGSLEKWRSRDGN